jgi:hypothetical protein
LLWDPLRKAFKLPLHDLLDVAYRVVRDRRNAGAGRIAGAGARARITATRIVTGALVTPAGASLRRLLTVLA